MSRPDILFPLFGDLMRLPGIGKKTAQHYKALRITRPVDLLFALPQSGIDRTRRDSIRDVILPAIVTVEVTIGRHLPSRPRGPSRIQVEDARTGFDLVFFHNGGDRLIQMLPPGQRRIVSGRVELFDGTAQMPHPDYILPPDEAERLPLFEPIYPLGAGLTQRGVARAVQGVLDDLPDLAEWIDTGVLSQRGWPGWADALRRAHAPKGAADLALTAPARARLAYDEVFAHQLTLAVARANRTAAPGAASIPTGRLQAKVRAALPYAPTQAQDRAIAQIVTDMATPHRMNRLLQGDVGSGKTLVALMALIAAVEAGGQGVLMAPTGILAQQHLDGLLPLAEGAGIVMALLTGRDKGAERRGKLAALARGDIQILIGTHAAFQTDVVFADLRLAIVDEQHRFGVGQRLDLGAKGQATDVLVMTATPIPRSLQLAQYGDMEVSVLDEKPPGRQPITTALIGTDRLQAVIERLRAALADGRQAYWVCPLVEESETRDWIAAEDRFASLRAILGADAVGLVHGQMPAIDKDAAMARFTAGTTGVLVATTVIEVGVNVPNASIMVIERAETFGLAQLHQLRGRVGRGTAESTCLLVYQSPLSETARRRLEILRQTEDGFRIAEEDMAMRGAGDIIGHAQSGQPRFRIADPERQGALMALAHKDARALLAVDPHLSTPRGRAARHLLWLMERDQAIRLIRVG